MKTIAHFLAVSMKYFFNIEYHVYNHVFTVILVIAYSLKMIPAFFANELYEGMLTIKRDFTTVKTEIAHNIRSFRNGFPG